MQYSSLAFQMMAMLGLAVWAGISLDQYLGLRFPAFTISLALISVLGVIFWLIKSIPKA
ncbi:MAG: ATPase F0F1 [Bacteroidia bacterium]|nr:ATPase F0F1 [Bacteroidia bacterium]